MNWKSNLLTAAVTGIVTILTGMALFYLQLRQPKLQYTLDQTIPFQGDKETLTIQNVTFRNDGTSEVKSVVATVKVSQATIRERRLLADPSLTVNEHLLPDSYRIELGSLNPRDKVQLSLLTGGPLSTLPAVSVSLRGEGVTGEIAAPNLDNTAKQTIVPAVAAAYTGLLAALLMSRRYRQVFGAFARSLTKGSATHGAEQHHAIASMFALRGGLDQAEYYLTRRTSATYWAESDLIAAKAIQSDDRNLITLSLQVLEDLLNERVTMALESQAVVHFNAARLAARLDFGESAKNHFEKAKKLDADMVRTRLPKDQAVATAI